MQKDKQADSYVLPHLVAAYKIQSRNYIKEACVGSTENAGHENARHKIAEHEKGQCWM